MRKKLFVLTMSVSLILSACGNQTGERGENGDNSSVQAVEEVLPENGNPAPRTLGQLSAGPVNTDNLGNEAPGISNPEPQSAGAFTVQQEGGAGTLQVTLPEGWAYETFPEDSGQLRAGDYGIRFYPQGESEGCIELGYIEFFGVCGTGLEEKNVTLAGDAANIGTYDNHDYWDFIRFRGKNEGIVAQSYDVKDWWQEYETQVLEILDTACLIQTDATGQGAGREADTISCGTNQEPENGTEEDSYLEKIGLSLSVEESTAAGATLVFRQSGGEPEGELSFGTQFRMERYEGGEWIQVPVVRTENYMFEAVAYSIGMDQDTEYRFEWKWLYGELEPGNYRIGKTVHDFRKTADFDSYEIYGYFDI
ncbi:MAG: hypothetical protein HFH06_04430 [Lachnospiraceae bacterium]|nr:hypothetical protein [Lachnospiraceae bacterium]